MSFLPLGIEEKYRPEILRRGNLRFPDIVNYMGWTSEDMPWLYAGSALNVATSLGIGELVTSHLIKFYNAPATTAVAIGALLQTVCVWTQAVFIIVFSANTSCSTLC